jgi:acylphosphatase
MTGNARAHVFVSGIVQGVFFRASTRDEARSQGLRGWVRNLPDGRVEAIFEGNKRDVASMLLWCTQGPDSAKVDNVESEWEGYKGEFKSFDIIA